MSDEEERYFNERELERRKKAQFDKELEELNQAEAKAVAKVLGINDESLARELVDLGFAHKTAGVFPLLPLVYVAWADGSVSNAERSRILELAEEKGAKPGTAGYEFLSDLLERPLQPSFFDTCIKTIRKILENRTANDGETSKQDLVSLSLSVAEASGGFLGLFGDKVSDEERKVLEDITRELDLNNKAEADRFLKAIDA